MGPLGFPELCTGSVAYLGLIKADYRFSARGAQTLPRTSKVRTVLINKSRLTIVMVKRNLSSPTGKYLLTFEQTNELHTLIESLDLQMNWHLAYI